MDQEAIKLEARLGAIEYMVGQLFKISYGLANVTPEMIEKSHETFREKLRMLPVPDNDPAISDLVAQEMQDAHEHLLGIIEEAVATLKRQ